MCALFQLFPNSIFLHILAILEIFAISSDFSYLIEIVRSGVIYDLWCWNLVYMIYGGPYKSYLWIFRFSDFSPFYGGRKSKFVHFLGNFGHFSVLFAVFSVYILFKKKSLVLEGFRAYNAENWYKWSIGGPTKGYFGFLDFRIFRFFMGVQIQNLAIFRQFWPFFRYFFF